MAEEEPYKPAQCRFRLDLDSSATLTLEDGRKLGYAQYGSLSGKAVFYLHGLPGSRLEAAAFDELAATMHARIIAVDRPGYGWSSPHPNRTILSHAKDVECLAEHLNLTKYGVIGISGGGPYAIACAASMPADKLRAVTLVCGVGTYDMSRKGMNWMHWLGWTFFWRYLPSCVCWMFKSEITTKLEIPDNERLELMKTQIQKSSSKKDADAITDDDLLLALQSSREAFAHGLDAFGQDGQILNQPYGFRIEDIRPDLPVHLWYGSLDDCVPPGHGEEYKRRLGDRAELHSEDETHWTITLKWREQYLRELVDAI